MGEAFPARVSKNLVIRFSGQMIDQPAIASWPHTSTVSTKPEDRTCPAPDQNNECKVVDNVGILDIKNICYGKH